MFAAVVAGIATISPRPVAASELFSESVTVPPLPLFLGSPVSGWNGFGILLSSADKLPAQNATDTFTDPFAVNGTSTITDNSFLFDGASTVGQWVGPGPVTLGGLQRLHFTGTVPINLSNLPNQHISNPTGEVQFGVTGPIDNSVMHIVGQHWNGATALAGPVYMRSEPVVSVTPNPAPPATPPPGVSFKYIVDFIQFTENGASGTEWVEFPYLPGQQPTFTYGGWADVLDPIHFTNHEVQLSDTQIPLDDLNYLNDPPSASGPTGFTAEALPADVVPEPTGLALFGAGVTWVFLRRGRRITS
jgi:hypothetical protein